MNKNQKIKPRAFLLFFMILIFYKPTLCMNKDLHVQTKGLVFTGNPKLKNNDINPTVIDLFLANADINPTIIDLFLAEAAQIKSPIEKSLKNFLATKKISIEQIKRILHLLDNDELLIFHIPDLNRRNILIEKLKIIVTTLKIPNQVFYRNPECLSNSNICDLNDYPELEIQLPEDSPGDFDGRGDETPSPPKFMLKNSTLPN